MPFTTSCDQCPPLKQNAVLHNSWENRRKSIVVHSDGISLLAELKHYPSLRVVLALPDPAEWLLVSTVPVIVAVHTETLHREIHLEVSGPLPDIADAGDVRFGSLYELLAKHNRLHAQLCEGTRWRIFTRHTKAFGLLAICGPAELGSFSSGDSCI